jgi:hypothetical protein
MPKKTIYVKDADLPLWARAESSAGDDSLSGVLTEALRRYLDGLEALIGQVLLEGNSDAFSARVQPMAAGWLLSIDLGVEDSPPPRRSSVWRLLEDGGLLDRSLSTLSARDSDAIWLWVPAHRITSIRFQHDPAPSGVDYPAIARKAWVLLRKRAEDKTPITYGEFGKQLGGLHPLHEVPKVLDLIAHYCRDHDLSDLTALVVNQRTGLPGHDFWQQNGWGDLTLADQVVRWQALLDRLQNDPGPEQLSDR